MEYAYAIGVFLWVALGLCVAWFLKDWVRIRAMMKDFFDGDLESLRSEVDDLSVELSQVWGRIRAMEKRVKELETEDRTEEDREER